MDTPGRVARAFATYGILVLVVLVGQVGNFGSVRKLPPPVNVTALLRCGQPGNTQCPDPWVGQSAAAAPQGFRFPVWDFQWPGSYAWSEGKPVPLIRRAPPVAAAVTPYPLTYRLDFLASAGTLVFIAARDRVCRDAGVAACRDRHSHRRSAPPSCSSACPS